MGGFHQRVVLRVSGKKPQRRANRIFEYPPLEEAMQAEGLEEMETYIFRFQNTVAQ